MFDLRWYQSGAIDALWNALRHGIPAPVACLPTGSGKSAVASSICRTAVMRQEAMHWLQQRTIARMRRGVGGTHVA